jgi:Ca2+/H+ antiporter, TMEM165/GDT1 family
MDWRILLTTFAGVFLAELGDKTQLATFALSAESPRHRWSVFLGSAGALVTSSLIAVLAAGAVARYIPQHYLRRAAAALFIVLGAWTWWRAGRP